MREGIMGSERLKIKQTKKTPGVELENGKIVFDGRSIPEDSSRFYKPIYDWIKEYTEEEITATRVDFNFEYINTSSTKWVYAVLKEIGLKRNLAEKFEINWFYEEGDEDMKDLGYILKSLVMCPFTLIKTEEKK